MKNYKMDYITKSNFSAQVVWKIVFADIFFSLSDPVKLSGDLVFLSQKNNRTLFGAMDQDVVFRNRLRVLHFVFLVLQEWC